MVQAYSYGFIPMVQLHHGLATHGVPMTYTHGVAMAYTHGAAIHHGYAIYPWCTYGSYTHGVAIAYTHGVAMA